MRLYTGVSTRDTGPRGSVPALAPCLTRRVADRCPPRRPRQLPDRCPARCGAVVVVRHMAGTPDLARWTLRAHDLPGAADDRGLLVRPGLGSGNDLARGGVRTRTNGHPALHGVGMVPDGACPAAPRLRQALASGPPAPPRRPTDRPLNGRRLPEDATASNVYPPPHTVYRDADRGPRPTAVSGGVVTVVVVARLRRPVATFATVRALATVPFRARRCGYLPPMPP